MGAGNAIILSYDNELYRPTTYFIDFSELYTHKSKLDAIGENFEDRKVSDLTEDEINEEFNRILEWDVECFQDDYFFNLDEEFDIWEEPYVKDIAISELSASYRGSALIIAYNDDCLVLTTDECETHHYPIALIPNFKYEDICEEYHDDNIDKQDWYEARGKDFDEMVNKKALVIYNKRLKEWKAKYEPFMRYMYGHYKEGFSVRNGPWMSLPLKIIGDDFKFL